MSYRMYENVTVPAGQSVLMDVSGAYMLVYEANLDRFKVKFDTGQFGIGFAGMEVSLPPGQAFTRVEFQNPNGTDLTLDFGVSNGEVRDRRLKLSGTGLSLSKATGLADAVDVTLSAASADLIAAANADRREISITNLTGAEIRVGTSNVTATRGQPVPNGATFVLPTTAAVYGFSTGGGDVAVLETED